MPRKLARHLEDRELVRPRSEPAEALEVIELREDVHERVIGALLRHVVELGTGQWWTQRAPPTELVVRRPAKDVVERCDRLIVAGIAGMQLLDPPARAQVPGRRSSAGRLGHRALDSHEQIVDRLAVRR